MNGILLSCRRIAPLHREKVKGVGVVRMYFVFRHRNAWHSTRIQRYASMGAFSSDIATAKRWAESHRKQGNVLHIDELPALEIRTTRRTVYAIEVNDGLYAASLLVRLTTTDDRPSQALDFTRLPADTLSVLIGARDIQTTLLDTSTELCRHDADAFYGPRYLLQWLSERHHPLSRSILADCATALQSRVDGPF